MANGIYLAGAAMAAKQVQQEALVYNLANVGTPGFKAGRVFAEVLREVGGGAEAVQQASRGQKMYIDFSQGEIEPTGRSLDMAIDGDGFFTVETPEGEAYTRNGNFSIDEEGKLVNGAGMPVLGDGGPLQIPGTEFEVNARGEIVSNGQTVGKLLISDFDNRDGLERREGGLFGPRPGALLAPSEGEYKVCQGCLESSNARPMEEMVRMTTLLRQYESSQRAVQLQNSALGRLVNELIQG